MTTITDQRLGISDNAPMAKRDRSRGFIIMGASHVGAILLFSAAAITPADYGSAVSNTTNSTILAQSNNASWGFRDTAVAEVRLPSTRIWDVAVAQVLRSGIVLRAMTAQSEAVAI